MKIKKLMSLSRLQSEIEPLQREGEKIVFTNGCFDLLHVGHVRYLTEARRLGDRLVVAVNSDRSVQGLKGPMRPIVPQRDRLEILAALQCVDYLILFTGKTPRRLIASLQPDVLVKGGDWALKDIVGYDLVVGWGGRVVRIKLVPGSSTTNLIHRIVECYGAAQ